MSENANMKIYEKVRTVPAEAKRIIDAGRLKGFTDINPMWRIKKLTEMFGACGFGWKYVIVEKRIDFYEGEAAAFVDINLFVKDGDTWSDAIIGTGGALFGRHESKGGAYLNDEAFKMALTDAISVAAKALGVAADVYYEKDRTKYDAQPTESPRAEQVVGASSAPSYRSTAADAPVATTVKTNPANSAELIARYESFKVFAKEHGFKNDAGVIDWDSLMPLMKEVHAAKQISASSPIDASKRILWTMADFDKMESVVKDCKTDAANDEGLPF
jgi:hypothetical protein